MINKRIVALLGGLGLLLAGCAQATPAAPTVEPLPPAEQPTSELTPSVSVSDQDVSGGIVTIDQVVAVERGWLVIHIAENGAPGPVIGQTQVRVGTNDNVQVEIDLDRATGQLFAMLHVDAGYPDEYEFPGPDVPVFAGEAMVNVPFNATFAITSAVIASNQAAVDGKVTIDSVSASEPSWIVIHVDANGAPGPVIGFAPVPVGHNQDVVVEIDLAQATPTLYAMLHVDAGVGGEYNFPGEDLPTVDAQGAVVMAPFQLLEAEASTGEVVISIAGVSFGQKEVTVPVGTTVKWVHSAPVPHTVTSDDGLFDSGTLTNGGSFSYTFDQPGTFAYYCRFHGGPGGAGMSATIIVEEG